MVQSGFTVGPARQRAYRLGSRGAMPLGPRDLPDHLFLPPVATRWGRFAGADYAGALA